MGCTFAHPRPRGETTPHLFKVLNMDRDGIERSPGKIEITESELVFHQKNKEPIQWPLRSLRRYGFDAELFSFESGRRCPTGPGIYAFKCSRAEALFNLLQECIQRAGQQEDASPRPTGVVIDATQRPMSVADWHPSADPNPRPGATVLPSVSHSGGSSHTNGVVTLQSFPQISNNGHEYVNADTLYNGPTVDSASASNIAIDLSRQVSLQSDPDTQIQYAELDLGHGGGASQPPVVTNGDSSHAMYMNLPAKGDKAVPSLSSSVPLIDAPLPPVLEEEDTAATENTANYLNLGFNSVPEANPKSKVVYIEVGFKNSDQDSSAHSSRVLVNGQTHLDRGNDVPGYAEIDFNKTAAINAKNTKRLEDEGTRKTRHNSNIDF